MHTPPTAAAMEGATKTLAFLKTSTASGVQGMFDPIRIEGSQREYQDKHQDRNESKY